MIKVLHVITNVTRSQVEWIVTDGNPPLVFSNADPVRAEIIQRVDDLCSSPNANILQILDDTACCIDELLF